MVEGDNEQDCFLGGSPDADLTKSGRSSISNGLQQTDQVPGVLHRSYDMGIRMVERNGLTSKFGRGLPSATCIYAVIGLRDKFSNS